MLNEDLEWICDWLNDDSDGENYEIWIDADHPIGRVFNKYTHDWKDGAIPASRLVVGLRKDESHAQTWFKFCSVYVEATKEDVEAFKNSK